MSTDQECELGAEKHGTPREHAGDVKTASPDGWRGALHRRWMWFLAYMRWSSGAVCEMSKGRGLHDDFHDYPDTASGYPDHFVKHRCVRCGKEFII
jgi:hypothetical protein